MRYDFTVGMKSSKTHFKKEKLVRFQNVHVDMTIVKACFQNPLDFPLNSKFLIRKIFDNFAKKSETFGDSFPYKCTLLTKYSVYLEIVYAAFKISLSIY